MLRGPRKEVVEKGFIRAEVVSYQDFIEQQGEQGAKDVGKWRLEGKDYVVADGDVVHLHTKDHTISKKETKKSKKKQTKLKPTNTSRKNQIINPKKTKSKVKS